MMKIMIMILLGVLMGMNVFVLAQGGWERFGDSPERILDSIVDIANEDHRIQDSPLERVNQRQGGFPLQYRIVNTLDSIRMNIVIYIQWAIFLGLAAATIGLIWIGFLMVTNSVGNEGTIDKVKTRVIGIVVGVILITGFYAIIRLFTAIITAIFGNPSGGSGF